ncbi:conserved hypothetical protein [Ricinus communis]|uniref:Uncharacterized protein n=1 Tax=Ricinus communis TaxID=3988 RepID=B9SJV8_RICCO|nr:conserved hypothetical protein [Ricinus communis]
MSHDEQGERERERVGDRWWNRRVRVSIVAEEEVIRCVFGGDNSVHMMEQYMLDGGRRR